MTESLKLGGSSEGPKIRRLNRVPIILAIALVVIFFAVIFYGLSSRGLRFGDSQIEPSSAQPASNDAERLKQGVPDGIIGEPQPAVQLQPVPAAEPEPARNPFERNEEEAAAPPQAPALEPDEVWRARLQREFDEQMLREYNRQQMASIQADEAAANSPIAINLQNLETGNNTTAAAVPPPGSTINRGTSALDLYSAALQAGIGQQNADPNGQAAKQDFFNQDIADLGYLTRTLAAELGPFGIRVNAIAPGIVETERLKKLDPSMGIGTPEQLQAIALRRFANTEDMANVLEFLVTDLSGYVTGQVISACGGAVLHPN